MSAITEAAKSVALPVVQKPSGFHWTDIQWADIVGNPLRAITTRDCWVKGGDVVEEGTEEAKLIEAGSVGWFCVKVSEGCRDCYSETMNIRFGCGLNYKAQYLKSGLVKIVLDEERLEAMLKWKIPKGFKSKVDGSDRPKCFPFDMTDAAGEWVSFEMLHIIFAYCALREDIDFMLLTKRIDRMAEYTADPGRLTMISQIAAMKGHGEKSMRFRWPLPNVGIGISAENQKAFDARIQSLLECNAAWSFLSLEPLLGEIDIHPAIFGWCPTHDFPGGFCVQRHHHGVHRVRLAIGGCESGASRRHVPPKAYRSLRDQCADGGIAYFQKQMEVGGKVTGEINKFPANLRIRQFPKLEEAT